MIINERFEPEIAELLAKLLSPRDRALLNANLNDREIAEVFGADAWERLQELVQTLRRLKRYLNPAAWEIQCQGRILSEFKCFKELLQKGKEADLTQTEEFACALAALKTSEHPVGIACIEALLKPDDRETTSTQAAPCSTASVDA